MALQSLDTIRGLQDPLKQFQVEFTICELPTMLLAKVQQMAVGLISGNKETASAKELHLRCTSFSYPSTKIKQTHMTLGTFQRKRGTIQDRSGTWTCKITEDQDGSVLNIMQSWIDLIHNPVSGIRMPSLLYATIARIVMQGKKSDRTLWMRGFYPISLSVGDINTSSSDPVEVTVTFNYDYYAENSYSVFGFTM